MLSEQVGIPDCVFVHASGFIGGHQTKEGAIYMAKKVQELFSISISMLEICIKR